MMNADGSGGTGSSDDQQMISVADRENYIARLTSHLGGNRELAMRFDDIAYNRSAGKAAFYRRILQALIQQRNQQIQQQQSMMNSQGQQQMYMQPQQTQMSGMPQQQQQQQPPPPQPSYTMQTPQPSSSSTVMNIKQEPQISLSNMQPRISAQNFPTQQQIKQELMVPPIQQQQQQQPGLQIQQMRSQQQQQLQPPLSSQYMQQQQTPVLPSQPTTTTPQQRTLAQHLQQLRQQNHLNQQQQQQQQQESPNPSQLQQQQQQPTNSLVIPQSSSGSQDEILQHLLSSPNPPKQPSTAVQNAAQARLRTMNRNIRQPVSTAQVTQQQQQSSPIASGPDPMMTASSSGAVSSPHSHPGMMQQQQASLGPPVQSPLARYMMAQSPQSAVYRPQMSPMNTMNYTNSPMPMIDDEIQFLLKFFTERIQYLIRIIARCQQEGQLDKIPKYRHLHDQMSAFIRNPISEHLMVARRLKEHIDRILGPVLMPPVNEMSTMVSSNTNNTRLLTNGIFEQCQRTIVDYLGKDSTLKYNISKRFLEPLNEVLNGVPHKIIRLDSESKQIVKPNLSSTNNHSLTLLNNIIESEFAHLSMNTYSYELKPMYDKISTSSSIIKNKDSIINDYELTCRLIEINMPIVPPLKMKLTSQYPNEPPEILSLISTAMNVTPTKLENSDGNTFFESISRNFVCFLFKLPTQHTVTDILDIWRTAIRNGSLSQIESEK